MPQPSKRSGDHAEARQGAGGCALPPKVQFQIHIPVACELPTSISALTPLVKGDILHGAVPAETHDQGDQLTGTG